jgi:hypothetical protein
MTKDGGVPQRGPARFAAGEGHPRWISGGKILNCGSIEEDMATASSPWRERTFSLQFWHFLLQGRPLIEARLPYSRTDKGGLRPFSHSQGAWIPGATAERTSLAGFRQPMTIDPAGWSSHRRGKRPSQMVWAKIIADLAPQKTSCKLYFCSKRSRSNPPECLVLMVFCAKFRSDSRDLSRKQAPFLATLSDSL